MFYNYVHHNLMPDEFAKKSPYTQFLISKFTEVEIEKKNEEIEEMSKNK